MISGLLLAAGLSSRFGSSKALALLDSTPAITTLLEKLILTSLDEIIVVLGANSELIEPCLFKHRMIRVVYNKHYKFGQTSSVQTGLQSLSETSRAFMILPVDCPFIKTSTVEQMITEFKTTLPEILVPAYQSHRGHPPVFDIKFKDPILQLSPTEGINQILHAKPDAVTTIELDDAGITQSFNTPEELAAIKKSIGIV